MKTSLTSIAIVDDHDLFAKGLASLIDSVPGFKVSIIATNGLELLESIKINGLPDVILLDIEMPVMDGYQTMSILMKNHSNAKVIVLSMHKQVSFISKMILLGVSGYLLKNAQPEEVVNAIKSVSDGGLAFNDEAISVMKNIITNPQSAGLTKADFNEKELEVIKLVCEEKTNAEMSKMLGLGKSSIELIKKKINEKMGVKTAVGMAVCAVQNNLI